MRTIPSAPAPVTYLSSLAFEALVCVRSCLYSASLIPQRRLQSPVISIGNITVGGSGKTPLAIYIARALLGLGWNPAILSRGYGRRHSSKSWILAPESSVSSAASTLGDEPALIRRHLPSIWMGISRNRFETGISIEKRQERTVFILDDGFQHRRLHRDLDVVIVDRNQPLGANRLLPRGTLREPLSGLRRCHLVVINGMPEAETTDPVETEIRLLHPDAKILHCRQRIGSLVPFHIWRENPPHPDPAIAPHSAYLVSALGNPDRFHKDIGHLGIQVSGIRSYRDHYWLKQKDWLDCVSEARRQSVEAIIITEKDAVKISQAPDFPLLVSIQTTEISDASALKSILEKLVEKHT
jgi:tetraacyldisaccharide 4'-kinase